MERAIALLVIAAVILFVMRAIVRRQQAQRAENFQSAVGTPVGTQSDTITRQLAQFKLWRRANSTVMSAAEETHAGVHLHVIDYRHGTSTSQNFTYSYILIWIDSPTLAAPAFVAERRDGLPDLLQNVENWFNSKKPITLPSYPTVAENYMIWSDKTDEATLQALFERRLGQQFAAWMQITGQAPAYVEVRNGQLLYARGKEEEGEVSADFIHQTTADALNLWQKLR